MPAVTARPASPGYVLTKFVQRHRWPVMAAGLGLARPKGQGHRATHRPQVAGQAELASEFAGVQARQVQLGHVEGGGQVVQPVDGQHPQRRVSAQCRRQVRHAVHQGAIQVEQQAAGRGIRPQAVERSHASGRHKPSSSARIAAMASP